MQQYQGQGPATQYAQAGAGQRYQQNAAPAYNRQQQYDSSGNQGGVTNLCWPPPYCAGQQRNQPNAYAYNQQNQPADTWPSGGPRPEPAGPNSQPRHTNYSNQPPPGYGGPQPEQRRY